MNRNSALTLLSMLGCACAVICEARADYPSEVAKDHPLAWWRFQDKTCNEGDEAKDETGRHPGICLYLDAALVARGKDAGGAIINARPIQFGGDPFLEGASLDGELAEVAIYNTVLEESRLAAHFTSTGRKPATFALEPPVLQAPAPSSASRAPLPAPPPRVIKDAALEKFVARFNKDDNELYQGAFPNLAALGFLEDNIPRLDCPDEDILRTYYFRWWTFRKHLKRTPGGFIVDEFLPGVSWAGKYNTISCAAGHHMSEGRWLHDSTFLDDYARFWFRGGGEPRTLQLLGGRCGLGAVLRER